VPVKISRLDALVLAGGAGSRFGGGKLLARFNDRFLIEPAFQIAHSAPVRAVTVVTGADPRTGPVAGAMIPEEDGETNPLGIKGIGELGNVGTPAAIAKPSTTPPANASATSPSASSS
jgi:hypothetical protein